MRRTIAGVLPVLLLLTSCAGPQKLAEKSEKNLVEGDHWRAWQLATRALDQAPANPRARAAATNAGASIAREYERKIRALAEQDSLEAAEQVLEFVAFRGNAARYVTIPVDMGWPDEERQLRSTAARVHYEDGAQAAAARRPKQAHGHFADCERFVPNYRDAAVRADRAMQKALTRVAIVPLGGGSGLGAEVAQRWREDVERSITGHATFTQLLPGAAVEQSMRVSQLANVSRDDAMRLGRKAGADQVVWGTIGNIESSTRLEYFHDVVSHRVREKQPDGQVVTRWVDAPIEVVARLRDVTVHATYEIDRTRDGAALAQQRVDPSTTARVLWTSYQPVGDLDEYALVASTVRSTDPDRVRRVEAGWKAACGEATLHDVLAARVATTGGGQYGRGMLARFAAGTAFVFLEELPPANDLAVAALSTCPPLSRDLLKLDGVDDVDLVTTATSDDGR